ncbi:hypothetical protein ACTPD5_22020, partial [Clostridioides difficile]
ERVEFWEIVGLLHDLDFEMYPDEHCVKQRELMTELDLDKSIIACTIMVALASNGVAPFSPAFKADLKPNPVDSIPIVKNNIKQI